MLNISACPWQRDKALRATRLVSDCDTVSTSLMCSHQADLRGMLLLRSSYTHSGRLCGGKAAPPRWRRWELFERLLLSGIVRVGASPVVRHWTCTHFYVSERALPHFYFQPPEKGIKRNLRRQIHFAEGEGSNRVFTRCAAVGMLMEVAIGTCIVMFKHSALVCSNASGKTTQS